jgi:hypothetical protein
MSGINHFYAFAVHIKRAASSALEAGQMKNLQQFTKFVSQQQKVEINNFAGHTQQHSAHTMQLLVHVK